MEDFILKPEKLMETKKLRAASLSRKQGELFPMLELANTGTFKEEGAVPNKRGLPLEQNWETELHRDVTELNCLHHSLL